MEPLTLGLIGLAGIGGLTLLSAKTKTTEYKQVSGGKIVPIPELTDKVYASLRDATLIPVPPIDTWVEITLNDEKYLVAPRYIAPVGIGEAVKVAKLNNAELPSIALVNEIWRQADLKLEPRPRGLYSTPPSDFTAKTMNSPETHIDQLAIIDKQIKDSDNPKYKLLAGTHKDVVFDSPPGQSSKKIGIYGWHRSTGKPIQEFMWGHAHDENNPQLDWKDYSQGLRLVKKIT